MLFDLGYPPHQADHSRPGVRGTSLQHFFGAFPDEIACLRHVFAARYGTQVYCKACETPARWAVVNRRMVIHRRCRTRISPYAGTLMAHSRVPAQLWFYVMLHLANSAEGANADFLRRHAGIDTRSVQRMLYRIRLHLAARNYEPLIGSPGQHVHVRLERLRGAYSMDSRRNLAQVLLMAAGETVSAIVTDPARPHRLHRLLSSRVHDQASMITNCHHTSRVIAGYRSVRSSRLQFDPTYFLDNDEKYDVIAGFLASFRRRLRTQHQHVAIKHLWLYLAEAIFRFNRRLRSSDIFSDMVSAFPSLEPDDRSQLQSWYSDYT